MRVTETNFLRLLSQQFNRFDEQATLIKNDCFSLKKKLKADKKLWRYHDLLLYILAHPNNNNMERSAERELKILCDFLKKQKVVSETLENSGLPFTNINTLFSHDMVTWMFEQGIDLQGEPQNDDAFYAALRVSLPSAERELVTYGYSREDLLAALRVKPKDQLRFLAQQLRSLHKDPLIKDHFFDATESYVQLHLNNPLLSRSYNRFRVSPVFYQDQLLKKFDHLALIESALPEPISLSDAQKGQLIETIKRSMILTARETDPATYLLPSSLRYYSLERGIAIAIYGMHEHRQLPFESYIGYTLFKNGFPAAYGGAWLFGKRSLFGMNIFEAFRGGESGYMMCQLLRVYRHVFRVARFEVEPYQFGKDNADGIRSGAFWFYYRHGFRPLDKTLKTLAKSEFQKIMDKKGYQSSYHTLERFTESFIALELEPVKQPSVTDLNARITKFIANTHKGRRKEAELAALEKLELSNNKKLAAAEFSLLAGALALKEKEQLHLIRELIDHKADNVYDYQALLCRFFELVKTD